ncbi:hypothetical protein BGZ61DRAFT_127609 [Ilyonectria robusta]|uniref:uncharacterized protein n=1 Tax=Ilyonectria robusta TaxID=1079257 RepID=UPI001E8D1D01|nr:uncharacterized protein BGZ61DRAFT_127609 [Ilyonectria robusta]KAH8734658.1 hypothetical protein BGZ61DRAFT_127609 [Ilyonectria robusta]
MIGLLVGIASRCKLPFQKSTSRGRTGPREYKPARLPSSDLQPGLAKRHVQGPMRQCSGCTPNAQDGPRGAGGETRRE